MAILFRWKAVDNDNSALTDVTTDGTATYTGSPLKKEFQKAASTAFNELGHYYTAGVAGAVGLRFIAFVQISSTTATDVFLLGVNRNTSGINNTRTFYVSGATLYTNMGGGSGVAALASNDPSPLSVNTTYKLEQVIRSGGGSDFYVNDLIVQTNPGTEGFDFSSGAATLRFYCNHAKCNNFAGVSRWIEAYITDSGTFTPPTPSGLAVDSAADNSIDISWTDVATATNADGISIEYRIAGDAWGVFGTVALGVETESIGPGLLMGNHYEFRVRAYVVVNGVTHYGSYSATATGDTTIAAPTGLTATASSATQIDLEWEDPSNGSVDGFSIERSIVGSGSGFSEIDTVEIVVGTQTYSDTTAQGNTQYFYRVRAYVSYNPPTVYGDYSSEADDTTPVAADTGIGTPVAARWAKFKGRFR